MNIYNGFTMYGFLFAAGAFIYILCEKHIDALFGAIAAMVPNIKLNIIERLIGVVRIILFAIFWISIKIKDGIIKLKCIMPEVLCRFYFNLFVRDHLLLTVHVGTVVSYKLILITYECIMWSELDKHIRVSRLLQIADQLGISELKINIGKVDKVVCIYVKERTYTVSESNHTVLKKIHFRLIDL